MNAASDNDHVYRAPAPGSPFPPIGGTLRIIYLLVVSVMSLLFLGAVGFITAAILTSSTYSDGSPRPDETLFSAGMLSFVGLALLLYVQIGLGLGWLYKAWSWLPWDQRYTKHWRNWLTPGQVALMMLIPYFHYYWMFVANTGLCDALDRLRVSYPTSEPAPKTLAIVACVCQLVVPFPVGAIVWIIFMSKVEKMTKEMSVTMQPRHQQAF